MREEAGMNPRRWWKLKALLVLFVKKSEPDEMLTFPRQAINANTSIHERHARRDSDWANAERTRQKRKTSAGDVGFVLGRPEEQDGSLIFR